MKINILFISDADSFILEMIGYNIQESLGTDSEVPIFIATTHDEVMKNLDYDDIDLIIADMDIPTLEVYALYDDLQKDARYKNIAFVFTSSQPDDIEIAILKGTDNFFLKPIDVDALLGRLHKISKTIRDENMTNSHGYSMEDEDDEYSEIVDIYSAYTS